MLIFYLVGYEGLDGGTSLCVPPPSRERSHSPYIDDADTIPAGAVLKTKHDLEQKYTVAESLSNESLKSGGSTSFGEDPGATDVAGEVADSAKSEVKTAQVPQSSKAVQETTSAQGENHAKHECESETKTDKGKEEEKEKEDEEERQKSVTEVIEKIEQTCAELGRAGSIKGHTDGKTKNTENTESVKEDIKTTSSKPHGVDTGKQSPKKSDYVETKKQGKETKKSDKEKKTTEQEKKDSSSSKDTAKRSKGKLVSDILSTIKGKGQGTSSSKSKGAESAKDCAETRGKSKGTDGTKSKGPDSKRSKITDSGTKSKTVESDKSQKTETSKATSKMKESNAQSKVAETSTQAAKNSNQSSTGSVLMDGDTKTKSVDASTKSKTTDSDGKSKGGKSKVKKDSEIEIQTVSESTQKWEDLSKSKTRECFKKSPKDSHKDSSPPKDVIIIEKDSSRDTHHKGSKTGQLDSSKHAKTNIAPDKITDGKVEQRPSSSKSQSASVSSEQGPPEELSSFRLVRDAKTDLQNQNQKSDVSEGASENQEADVSLKCPSIVKTVMKELESKSKGTKSSDLVRTKSLGSHSDVKKEGSVERSSSLKARLSNMESGASKTGDTTRSVSSVESEAGEKSCGEYSRKIVIKETKERDTVSPSKTIITDEKELVIVEKHAQVFNQEQSETEDTPKKSPPKEGSPSKDDSPKKESVKNLREVFERPSELAMKLESGVAADSCSFPSNTTTIVPSSRGVERALPRSQDDPSIPPSDLDTQRPRSKTTSDVTQVIPPQPPHSDLDVTRPRSKTTSDDTAAQLPKEEVKVRRSYSTRQPGGIQGERKIRKSHGKSHPLSKLGPDGSGKGFISSVYNTM